MSCSECLHYRIEDERCYEWSRHIPPSTPACARFLSSASGEGLFDRIMLQGTIEPYKQPEPLSGSYWLQVAEAKATGKTPAAASGTPVAEKRRESEMVHDVSNEDILKILVDEGMSQTTAAKRLGMSYSALSSRVQRMIARGELRRTDRGRYERVEDTEGLERIPWRHEPEVRANALQLVKNGTRPTAVTRECNVPAATLYEWISEWINDGEIKRIRRGQYGPGDGVERRKPQMEEHKNVSQTRKTESTSPRTVKPQVLENITDEIETMRTGVLAELERQTKLIDVLANEVREWRNSLDGLMAEIRAVRAMLEERNKVTGIETTAATEPAIEALRALERIATGQRRTRGSAA